MKFKNEEEFKNKEIEFTKGQEDYVAVVSYTLFTVVEYATREYPAECETTIENLEIESVEIWNEHLVQWIGNNPSEEVQDLILTEIQNMHKI
jgi:hypothetical protein